MKIGMIKGEQYEILEFDASSYDGIPSRRTARQHRAVHQTQYQRIAFPSDASGT